MGHGALACCALRKVGEPPPRSTDVMRAASQLRYLHYAWTESDPVQQGPRAARRRRTARHVQLPAQLATGRFRAARPFDQSRGWSRDQSCQCCHGQTRIWNPYFLYMATICLVYTWYIPCICSPPRYTWHISMHIACISIRVDINGISMDIPFTSIGVDINGIYHVRRR